MSGHPLPRWTYMAGEERRVADHETLGLVKALVPSRYDDCVPATDVPLRYGLTLNDAGFFWEAHEILEAVWKAAPKGGRDRILLRACIQIANANLKRRMNRSHAARRLLREALGDLDEWMVRGPDSITGGFGGMFDAPALRAVLVGYLDQPDAGTIVYLGSIMK
jgi:hypothetical protein